MRSFSDNSFIFPQINPNTQKYIVKTTPYRRLSKLRLQSLVSSLGLAAVTAPLFFSNAANAAAITWDNGNTNQLWSDSLNWNPDSAAAGNDITFAAAGTAASGTVTNIVDANTNINSLTWTNVGGAASAHTTEINSGVTLTVSGTTSPSVQVNTATTASSSYNVIKGAGTFSVTSGTGVNFNVGSAAIASGSGTQTLDMSGLAVFSANVGAFNVGNGQRNTGTVSLASNSTITATSIQLGGNTATGGPANAQLNLGTTNILNADTITVGSGRTGATLAFQSGLTSPTISIANRAGTGAANLTVGVLDTNASGGPNSSADFSAGTLTANLGTVTLGRSANSSAGGSATGTLIFGAGSLTATTMNVGNGNTGTSTAATGNGVVTMNANAGTLTATTVTLGKLATGARNNSANGTFNQNGGTAVITTLQLADGTGNTGAGMTISGTYNLAAGTLKAGTIAAGTAGSGAATYNRTFNWTGGTIQNLNASTDTTIGGVTFNTTGASNQTFSVDSGRSITVNSSLTGTGGFTKIGDGTLNLNGATNNYSGGTTVNDGAIAYSTAFTMSGANAFGLVGAASPALNTDFGHITSSAAFTYGGTLVFNFSGVAVAGASYDLFDVGSSTGAFTDVSIGGSYASASFSETSIGSKIWELSTGGLKFTFTADGGISDGVLLVSAVPEPSAFAAIAGVLGLGFAASRRRRAA